MAGSGNNGRLGSTTAGAGHNGVGIDHNAARTNHNVTRTDHNATRTAHNAAPIDHNATRTDHNASVSGHNAGGRPDNAVGTGHNATFIGHNAAGSADNAGRTGQSAWGGAGIGGGGGDQAGGGGAGGEIGGADGGRRRDFSTFTAFRPPYAIRSMKNDLIEARLRRDEALLAFLNAEKAAYADIETDVAPLRQQLSSALTKAQDIAQDVLTADNDGSADRKKGQRNQLTQLLRRLVVGLQSIATSANDARLLALSGQVTRLPRLPETGFVDEARRLLSLAPERSEALEKRRFTPEHYRQAVALNADLRRAISEGRLNDTEGSTGRQSLERLIKQNSRAIEQLRTYFRIYELDEPALWQQFVAAAKPTKRGGAGGAAPTAR